MITGKEAKLAWANNIEVEYMTLNEWKLLGGSTPLSIFNRHDVKFRLKPRTINGIEVPAPFKPKIGDKYWILEASSPNSYSYISSFQDDEQDKNLIKLGAWRTEEEIKQVVEALRSIFK